MNVSTFLFMSEPIPGPAATGAAIETAPEDIAGEPDGGFFTVMRNVVGGEGKETVPASEDSGIVQITGQSVDTGETKSGDPVVEGADSADSESSGMSNLTGRSGGLEAILQIIAGSSPSDVIVTGDVSPKTEGAIPIGESRGNTVAQCEIGSNVAESRLTNGALSSEASRPTVNQVAGVQMETALPEAEILDGTVAQKTGRATERNVATPMVQNGSVSATGDQVLVEELSVNGREELRQIDTMDIKGADKAVRVDVSGGRPVSGDAVINTGSPGEVKIPTGMKLESPAVAGTSLDTLKDGAVKPQTGEVVQSDRAVKTDLADTGKMIDIKSVKAEGTPEAKIARSVSVGETETARTEVPTGNSTAVKSRDGFERAASDIRTIRITESTAQVAKGGVTVADKAVATAPVMRNADIHTEIPVEKTNAAVTKIEIQDTETQKSVVDPKPLETVARKPFAGMEASRVVSKPVVKTVERVVERVVSTPVQQTVSAGATLSEEVRVDVKRSTAAAGNAETVKSGDAPVVTEERVITRVKNVAVPVQQENVEKQTVPDDGVAKTNQTKPALTVSTADSSADVSAESSAKTETFAKTDSPVNTETAVKSETPVKAEAVVKTEAPVKAEAVVKTEVPVKAEAVARPDFSISETAPVRVAASASRSESVTPEMRALRESVLDQLSNGTRSLTKEGAKEVVIGLDPPELGKLKLKIAVVGSSIRGLIEVENQAVKAALQSDLPRLSAALAESGLDLGRFDVHVADERNRGGGREYEQLPGRSSRNTEENRPEDGEPREQPRRGSENRVVDYWM